MIEALKSTPYIHNQCSDDYCDNEYKDEDTKEKETLDSDSTYFDHWKSVIRKVIFL